MLKDVTLGQFFPGSTPIHKLDPRTKLVLVIVYIVALFLAKWFVSYVVVAAFLAMVIAMSRIRLKVVLKNLKPLLFIILLTAVLNLFYGQGEPIAQFWIFKITKSGLENAIFMVLRISLLVAGTFMLTYTTSPISLTDGLESLLSPLKKLHAPVHELSMMMSIALRFIPTLIEETDKIMSRRPEVRILNPGICSAGPRRWCPFLCRCSSAPSAVPTSLPRLWSAAAITAARAVPSSPSCTIRRATGSRISPARRCSP